jgi:HD-GYP domain-containing protein (c-di-GMP phosphodiesterase class II)
MMSVRPYRKTMSIADAVAELRAHVGTQFDPAIVDAFFIAFDRGMITERMREPLGISAAAAIALG